jgi:hypothetical protein
MDSDFGILSGSASESESLQVAAIEAAMRAGAGQGQVAADRAAAAARRDTVEAYTLSAADGSEQDLDAHTVIVR